MGKYIAGVISVLLASCTAIEHQMQIEATGARYATTPESVPVALFDEPVSEIGRIIADWCSGVTVLPSEIARRDLIEALDDLAADYSIEWSLDAQSAEKVKCRAEHDYSNTYEGPDLGPDSVDRPWLTGGINYDFIYEWVTFTLVPTTEGNTCVIGAPESERQTGSYTDLGAVLAELGGSASSEGRSACSAYLPVLVQHAGTVAEGNAN